MMDKDQSAQASCFEVLSQFCSGRFSRWQSSGIEVRSHSPSPEIAKLDGQFFKIGFTTGSFEDRIRGAKDDPTFLMAPVHPVRTYDAINLNANKFENLIHRFFAEARMDIEVMDRFGKPFRPREWFLLPLPVIETAIAMLIDGTILQHRYDAVECEIVPRL